MELFAPMHILLILLVVTVLFGPHKLPEIGRSLGEGIREFKKAMSEGSAADPDKKSPLSSASTAQTASQAELYNNK